MSDWPQLERELQRSARERYGRSRRRAPRFLLAPAAVAAIAAALVVVVLAGEPSDERAVPPPAASPPAGDDISRYFAVFRRARTTADAIPPGTGPGRCASRRARCFDFESSRLVYAKDGVRIWLVRAHHGARTDICVSLRNEDRGGSAGCKPSSSARSVSKPMGSYGPPRNGRPGIGYTVLPDGIERVAYTLADGQTVVSAVRDNISVVTVESEITSLSWMAGDRRYVQSAPDPDPRRESGCPKLDPLPPDARHAAEAAARAAAPMLYDAPVEAVTSRPAKAADAGWARRQACGDEPTERSLVVALVLAGQPRADVMVGFRGGKPIVWNQLR